MRGAKTVSPVVGPQGLRAIPKGVWMLGFVSMFMDISSEMIHALLPVFLVTSLGASVLWVGLIEGVAEATAQIAKVFSGVLSDYAGRRKPLALLGYGLAAVTKPLFPLAGTVGVVMTARFIDRIGKGIRGAPRDALVADLAPPAIRGACFGLRQSLDTIGAVAGPLLAVALMLAGDDDIRAVFWVAVIPAALAVALLAFGVEEPEAPAPRKAGPRLSWADTRKLRPAYWGVVGIGAIFGMARFSEAFLVLKASEVGLTLAFVPLVLVAMNAVYALSAYPAGVLSDVLDRRLVLIAGLAVMAAADIVLALGGGLWGALAGVVLWGLHMGLTQGLLAALVADSAPVALRGTAFGVFNLVNGVALLAASLLAGWLWDSFGSAATFWAGAAFALPAMAGVALLRKPR